MKNLTISLAAMTLLFAGCQKPELVEPAADNLSFEATVEEFGGQTKTSLTSENYVVWSEGDRLAIFQGSSIADEYQLVEGSAGQNKGMFDLVEDKSGTVNGSFSAGTELPRNVAFYPYAEGVTLTGDMEGNKTAYILSNVVLPATQNYAANSFGNGSFPMVAATKSMEDHNLKFKNVLGAVKLSLKGTQSVKSIKVEGLNGEKLSGDATVTAYSNNLNPVIQMLSNASSAVTLDCGDGVQLNESEVTDFYIALPPVLFEKGFNVTVTDVADHEYTMTADQNNAVLRSSILVMPEQTLEAKEDDTPSDKSRDYVDEYGINHGSGVEIDGVVWAPVNCGYHATDYKWGKLYQWGRKYGQGYSDGNFQDAEVADVQSLQFSDDEAQSETYKNTYFNGSSDWFSGSRTISLWNDGTEDAPIKTDKDPCPEGWRVPTKTEFAKLIEHHSDFIQNEEGMNGYYFSGSSAYISNVPNIFLSAAGWRNYGSTYMQSKTQYRNEYATYFTSTLLESPYRLASVLSFDQSEVEMKGHERANAFSIRCVQDLNSDEAGGEGEEEDELVIPVMNVTLNPTSLILYEEDSAQL